MKVAIIGGSGKMGQWFARFLLEEGKEVLLIGRSASRLLAVRGQLDVEISTDISAVKMSDIVLISVPINSFEEVVHQLEPYVHPGQTVIDITSVKVMPVSVMHRYLKNNLVLGVHPLFGPGARGVADQNFALTPTNSEETALAQRVKGFLETRGARVTLTSPAEHDKMMAVVLGLAHFIAIVSADALSGFELKNLEAVSGTTFKSLLIFVKSIISEDPELYASIQMNLPDMAEIENRFAEKVNQWTELVKNKDGKQFVQKMDDLRKKMELEDPNFSKAYDVIYRFLDTKKE